MSDLETLVVFILIVGVMVASGVLVGMIVAGRIDRIMAAKPARRVEEHSEQEKQP
jgi:hypothetical protein